MADQEFLASFAVEIDEAGVTRLQDILEENRKLADRLSASFAEASAAIRTLSEDLGVLPNFSGRGITTEHPSGPGSFSLGLDLTRAFTDLDRFTELVKQPLSLKANASGIVSAGRSAWDSIRSLFSAPLTIRAKTETGEENADPPVRTSAKENGGIKPDVARSGQVKQTVGLLQAQDTAVGTADLRRLLSGLTPAARKSLADSPGTFSLPAGLAAGTAGAAHVTQNNQTVSAPVSIQVHASGADAQEIGQRLYDTAERYLLRTLRSVSG